MTTGTLPERDRAEAIETPHGPLHAPLGTGYQVLVLVAAFFGGPALGWVVGQVPGDLSGTARTMICVPFVLVFFLGYAAWVAHLKVIAFRGLGASLLKTFFVLIVLRRKPASLADVLPSREKLLEMAVRAQRAGGAFRRVGWLVGLTAGVAAALLRSAMGALPLLLLVSVPCIAWGYILALLARRGCLPIMEES
jgi:hypothetical protein